MTQLDILCIGSIEYGEDKRVLEAHSTSTLIRAGDRNIVVDASTDYMWPAIKTSFRQIGIFPEDVDTVIVTHGHSDHVGNLKRFRNAKVYIHKGADVEIPGAIVVEDDEFQICPGVRMVHTPGHTADSTSVFVEGDDRKYVCAGDAIPLPENLKEGKVPALNIDETSAMESMKVIERYADVVIPGHGAPFIVR